MYYHATPAENLTKIIEAGEIKTGSENLTYLCEKPQEAALFVALRGYKKIYVLGMDLPENEVQESFDHNLNYFPFRAFYTQKNIPYSAVTEVREYDL